MAFDTHFWRFALVGVAGFVVDWLILSSFLWLGISFLIARGLSFFCAVTTTWALNRRYTFVSNDDRLLLQWAKFVSANSFGGFLNYGSSTLLFFLQPHTISDYPIIAVAAGSLSGLTANFLISKHCVFNQSPGKANPSTARGKEQ